ncbi:MAG: hypothetical protein KF744_09250 [Taibaiella sp.]|nr:hypothetical protein [Taibaiella sp.]
MTFNFSFPTRQAIWAALCRASDWMDEHIFPDLPDLLDPMPKELAARQAMIERSANDIRASIDRCRDLADCYRCVDMVRNFQLLHGENPKSKTQIPSCEAQVTGWVASLGLQLKNKQEEIMKKYRVPNSK